MTLYDQFIQDVKKDPNNHCHYVKLAVQRHVSDLKKQKQKKYPYYFDVDEADRVIKIVKLLRHTKGSFARKHFDLQPYQAFILANIFGWLYKSTKLRKYKKAYIETARKSGKSEFAAAIEILMAFFDGEEGADVYTVATKKEQANYVFKAAMKMMRMLRQDSETMRDRIKLQSWLISDNVTDSIIDRLTADANKEDGANPYCGVIDEFHAHPNDGIYKVVETGVGSRDNPLILIITTAGFNKQGPCYLMRKDVVIPMLEGLVVNEHLFAMVFTLDEGDEWTDPKVWIKSNPNLGNTPKLDSFKALIEQAALEGSSARVQALTKSLNVWTDQADIWIAAEEWRNCANRNISIEDFEGKYCYCGMDLAAVNDLAVIVYVVPVQPGVDQPHYFIRPFCPSAKIQNNQRTDGVDYRRWSEQGHITVTPGISIDYDEIYNEIMHTNSFCEVRLIEYDRARAHSLITKLEEANIACNPHKQTGMAFNNSVDAFEAMVWAHPKNLRAKHVDGKDDDIVMVHDGNPVMAWMMSNVEIMYDTNGNRKIAKSSVVGGGKTKFANKVDGPVAAMMATTAMLFPPESGAYTDHEMAVA